MSKEIALPDEEATIPVAPKSYGKVKCLIQIVPRLPPAIDGIGDYSLFLARQMQSDSGITTHFIVGDPSWDGPQCVEGFTVSQVSKRTTAELLNLLSKATENSSTVLVQFGGYGYAKRGCPIWLIKALEYWRVAKQERTIVTMFHEIYSFGPPWRSSFWLSPLHQHLSRRLALLSGACLTSSKSYSEILRSLTGDKLRPITILPVFSNVGEAEQANSLESRKKRLVVFGGRGNRLQVYQKSRPELERVCHELAIEEVLDIGPPIESDLPQINGIPLTRMGARSAIEISGLLENSLAGFFNYDISFLAKSTIFAAYCAHGVIPISAACQARPADGLVPDKHYWVVNSPKKTISPAERQMIAYNAYAWYQKHSLSAQAKTFIQRTGFS